MTLTQALIFAVTMFILFGGMFYTFWVFRREFSGPSSPGARARNTRRDAGRSRRV